MCKRTYQETLDIDVGEKVCKQGRMNHTDFWNPGERSRRPTAKPDYLGCRLDTSQRRMFNPCRTFNTQVCSNIYTHRIPPLKPALPNMTEEPRKRSLFDQTEPPEPKRASRFDRRSRSPSSRKSESRRSRSPISSAGPMSPSSAERKKIDPAAAAAAAAAKINAQIQARKGIQHVDVPPIRSVHLHSHKDTT
jgi:hypothetical protein